MSSEDGNPEITKVSVTAAAGGIAVGTVLDDRYEIQSLLGSGGMCAVYKASHLQLGQTVAIKVLLPKMLADVQAVKRFQREAQTLADLKHNNIVTVFGFGVHNQQPYMVMEHVTGETLADKLN